MNTQKISALIIVMMTVCFAIAQPPPPPPIVSIAKHWQYSAPSPFNAPNADDWFYGITATSDGGYVGAGFVVIPDPALIQPYLTRFGIVKMNAHKTEEWNVFFPNIGDASYQSVFTDVIEVADGYIAVGSGTFNGLGNIVYMKFDKYTGNVIDTKYFPSIFPSTGAGYYVTIREIKTSSPPPNNSLGFIIGASITNTAGNPIRPVFIKLDVTGNLDNTFGAGGSGNGYTVPNPPLGFGGVGYCARPIYNLLGDPTGYILVGTAGESTPNTSDVYAARVDLFGDLQWQTTYSEAGLTANNGYVDVNYPESTLCPLTTANCPEPNPELANREEGRYIEQLSNGGNFIISAAFDYVVCFPVPGGCPNYPFLEEQSDVEQDVALIEIDPNNGNVQWAKNVAYSSGIDNYIPFVITNNGIILACNDANDNSAIRVDLVKTDLQGNVQWERKFLGDGVENCVFALAKTNDGGVIVAGNNELGDEDYLAIKMYPDCQASLTPNSINIPIGTTTWNSNMTIRGTVRIPNGAILIIQNGAVIEFADTRQTFDFDQLASNFFNSTNEPTRIIVAPGGRLIIRGNAVLQGYSGCPSSNKMWEGIQVWGNPNLSQLSSNQGLVILDNATIKDALYGIIAGTAIFDFQGHIKPTGGGGGGMIQAKNSRFTNCKQGVYFSPYAYSANNPNATKTFFAGCSFKCDAPLADPDFITDAGMRLGTDIFVTLNKNHGVTFAGNTFKYDASVLSQFPDVKSRGTGIFSLDASYKVISCFNPPPVLCQSGCCFTSNKFENLKVGIDASASTSIPAILVDGNTFNGNYGGVRLGGLNNTTTIIRNNFNGIGSADAIKGKNGYGIYMINCTGYTIEENKFQNSPGPLRYGIIPAKSGTQANQIYNNTCTGMQIGIQSQGTNRLNSLTGLQIKCNQNSGFSVANISVTSNGGIPNQGICLNNTTPAGNTFSNLCGLGGNDIIVNPSVASFLYRCHSDAAHNPPPSCINGAATPISCGIQCNTQSVCCPSNFGNPCNPPCQRQIITQINTLSALLAAGDALALYQIITSNSSSGQIKNALLAPGPYLSDGVLIAAITRTNPLQPGHIKEILIPNSPVTQPVMDALNSISLPNGIRKQINDAQTGTSARAQVESQLASLPPKDLAVRDLLAQYANDTSSAVFPLDSIIAFLQTQTDLTSKQTLLEAFLTKSDCQNARTTLNQVSGSSSAEFVSFFNLTTTLCEEGRTIFDLTSSEKQLLETLALGNDIIAVLSQNILRFVYGEPFPEVIEDLIIPLSFKLRGTLNDGASCGGNVVAGDTLVLLDSVMQIVPDVTPVFTDVNGNFVFDFFETASLDRTAQFTFATKSGLPLQPVGFNTISGWISQSPLTLVRMCPVTTYQKTIGGTGNEENNYCIHTSDGGFLIAGSTTSGGAGGRDIYVMRTDSAMNILWSRTFGGPNDDVLFDRQPTLSLGQIATPMAAAQSGGFIILGHTFSFGQGSSDLYLLRIGNNGNLIWSKTYGTNQIERGISVQQLSNGDLLLLGDVESGPFGGKDVYIIRTDVNGNTLWNKRLGAGGADQIFGAQVTSDGGFIFAGATTSSGAGNFDAHLLKSDASGNIQWSKTYGGFSNDSYQSIVELSGGGYAVTGYTQSFGAGTHDFVLSQVDDSGNILWSKTYGGGNSDVGDHLIKTSDGGYAFMGTTTSFGAGNLDVLLTKTDNAGNLQWSEVYGGAGIEIARSLDEMSSGGYHICGFTNSFGAGGFDIYSIRTDANGMSGCNEATANPTVTSPTLSSSNFTPNANVGGVEGTPATQTDGISFVTTTLCPSSARNQNPPTEPETLNLKPETNISVYPNPNNGDMTLRYFIPQNEKAELSIYDLIGRKKATYQLTGENNQLNISEKDLSEGIYFYNIISNGKKIKQDKIIIIK